jgi:hypothetical protein
MCEEKKPRIDKIKIKYIPDESPDTSWLGEYTDDLGPGVIVRSEGEFYEKLPAEMERDTDGQFIGKGEPDIIRSTREYNGFKPYAGGEKLGTKEFYKYGMQDFKRMEGFNQGDWSFIGVIAEAEVSYPMDSKGNRRMEIFTSSGIWGVESDSGDYLKDLEEEELADLYGHLRKFKVNLSTWNEKAEEAQERDADKWQ